MTTAARPAFEPARGGRGKGEDDLRQLSKQHSSRDHPLPQREHTERPLGLLVKRSRSVTSEESWKGELLQRKSTEMVQLENTQLLLGVREASFSWTSSLDVGDPRMGKEDEDEDFEEGSEDEDTAALLAELEKSQKERAEEQARNEQEQNAEEGRIHLENTRSGNPLFNLTGPPQPQANFQAERRWDDDVLFKNCAKGTDDQKKDKRVVNDTL